MDDLGRKVLAGEIRAASRLIRNIEDNIPNTTDYIKQIFPHTGKAHVVGFTGAPGAGKSTLTDEMICSIRKKRQIGRGTGSGPNQPVYGRRPLG